MTINEMRKIEINMTDEERELLSKAADLLDDLITIAFDNNFDEITLASGDDYEEYFEFNAEYDFLPRMTNTLYRFSKGEIVMEKNEF